MDKKSTTKQSSLSQFKSDYIFTGYILIDKMNVKYILTNWKLIHSDITTEVVGDYFTDENLALK